MIDNAAPHQFFMHRCIRCWWNESETGQEKQQKGWKIQRRHGGCRWLQGGAQGEEERESKIWKTIRRNRNGVGGCGVNHSAEDGGWEPIGVKKRLQAHRSRLKESLTHGRWSSGLPPPLRLRLSGCRSRAPGQSPQMSVWLPRQQMEHHHSNHQRRRVEFSFTFLYLITFLKKAKYAWQEMSHKNARNQLLINIHFHIS